MPSPFITSQMTADGMRPECILAVSKAAGRQITQAEARDIEARLRQNMRHIASLDRDAFFAMTVDQRLAAASAMAAKQLVGEAAEVKRRQLLSIQKQGQLDAHIDRSKAAGLDGLDALKRTLVFESDGKSNYLSAESRKDAVAADGLRQLRESFEATDSRIFGMMPNPEGVRALSRELFGEDSGSEVAKKGAEAFAQVAEQLRTRFNAAGGTIPSREDWHIPQHHDQTRVFSAGRDQ